MTAPLLEIAGLSVSIGGRIILDQVGFSVMEGELLAVIGPNGAGKSTCVRCLAGATGGWTGRIALGGVELRRLSRRELALRACYLPQTRGEPPAFSVREYVRMGRYAHRGVWGGMRAGDARAVDAALADAGIPHLGDRLLPTLSGGERQMAAIAAGLAQESRLLVLDEPATFLDPLRQDKLLDLLEKVNRERGVSVLMVTHDINAAMLRTHRAVALREGRLVYDGPSSGLARASALRDVYGMEFVYAALPGGGTAAVSAAMARAGERHG